MTHALLRHPPSDVQIRSIEFKTILPIWKSYLWPHRTDAIEAVSAMQLGGGINLSLMDRTAFFFGAWQGIHLLGGISGFETGVHPTITRAEKVSRESSRKTFRIRGVVVLPEVRGLGIGAALLKRTIEKSEELDCTIQWTTPRKDNLGFYEKAGFKQSSPWTYELFNPGPNCYALRYSC